MPIKTVVRHKRSTCLPPTVPTVPCKYFMISYESGHQLQKSAVPIPCTQKISDRKAGQKLQDLRPAAIVQPSCFRLPKVCLPKCSIYNGCRDAGSAAADDRLLRIDTFRYEQLPKLVTW